jgi:uncharacterized protein (TIGR02246 family)
MTRRWVGYLALPVMLVILAALPGTADQPKIDPAEGEAIKTLAKAFVEAFHKGDATGVANAWTEDGDYTDQDGHRFQGREAIQKNFAGLFAEHKGLKLRIDSDSLRMVTADVAVEDGTVSVYPPDGGPPSRARYTNVLAKKDGKWLLSSVRESPYAAPSNYEHLRGLEWLIGDWVGERNPGETERISVTWGEHQNFLHATFTTTFKNISVGNITQWIGWDPLDKRIRSWIFDETGGFGEGSWTRDGEKAVLKLNAILPDGKKLAATIILTPLDPDTIELQSRDRSLDGKPAPEMKEVKLKRAK